MIVPVHYPFRPLEPSQFQTESKPSPGTLWDPSGTQVGQPAYLLEAHKILQDFCTTQSNPQKEHRTLKAVSPKPKRPNPKHILNA